MDFEPVSFDGMKLVHEPGLPRHRVPVMYGGAKMSTDLMRTIDAQNRSDRNTLVFVEPKTLAKFLPTGHQRAWNKFSEELALLQSTHRLSATSTMKYALRLHSEGEFLRGWPLRAVCHRFGVVPGLVVGSLPTGSRGMSYDIALLDQEFGHRGGSAARFRDDRDLLERLLSLQLHIPRLFQAYFEQIAYFLRAMFFGASDDLAVRYCLRVREAIGQSIRTKLEDILLCPPEFAHSFAVAQQIRVDHAQTLQRGEAVDKFAHLLVNYIYRFFGITDRVDQYHGELAALTSERDFLEEDPVARLKDAAVLLRQSRTDDLLELVQQFGRQKNEEWLEHLVESSAFIAEVNHSAGFQKRFDTPRVFVSMHFETDSELFFDRAAERLRRDQSAVELVKGRKLGRDIRWSVLARVWLADAQLVVLPSSWKKRNGEMKRLKNRENWVMMELLYGHLINRELNCIVLADGNSTVVEEFRQNIARYTLDQEIRQADYPGWAEFVEGAKEHLRELTFSKEYLEYPLNGDATEFWQRFDQMIYRAAWKFVKSMLHAWCYFFDARHWSLVQALFEMGKTGGVTANQVTKFLRDHQQNPRYRWILGVDDLARTVESGLDTVAGFSFKFNGEIIHPVYKSVKKPLTVRLQYNILLEKLVKHLQLYWDGAELARFYDFLMTPRKD